MKKPLLTLVAGASLLTSQQMMAEERPRPSFSGLFSTTFANGYIPPAGFSIGGPVHQNYLELGFNNVLAKGDRVAALTWNSTDLSRHFEATEHDVGLTYTFSLAQNLTVSLGGQYWYYPSRRLGSHDWITDCNLTWNGPLTVGVQSRHLWEHSGVHSGDYAYLFASKSTPLGTVLGADVSLTLEGGTTYSHRFFGDTSQWSVSRGLATLTATKGNFSVGMSAGYQWNLDGDIKVKPNTPLVFGSISYSF